MGKKSRRNNRNGRSSGKGSNIPMFLRRLMTLEKEACDNYGNNLYSKAAHNYQEGLQIIQQLQNATLKNACAIDSGVLEAKAACFANIMMVEHSRCRFDKVVQIYHEIQMTSENEKVSLSFMGKLYGQLAMLRLDGSKENKERVISLIDTSISEGMADPNDISKAWVAVRVLTSMKEYDTAIDLGEKLGRMSEKRNIATLEIAISHLERYRVKYHHQKGKNISNDVLVRVHDAYEEFGDFGKNVRGPRGDAFLMMLAQRDYLCHQIDDKELSLQLCKTAIKNIEMYLEILCDYERHCHTCSQEGTATEVQLVCSGCLVACYCSLDHQRMTWKKDAINGTRIGHEILCPLMKVYRKWKLVSKKSNEKALKLRRRLDRECLYFLSHGLGLKDKCFREEDVYKFS